MIKFIEYPKCTTCQKAKKYLDECSVKYDDIDIKSNNPSESDLKKYIKNSGKDINKFFNTSGLKYRELNLKEKLSTMNDDDKIKLLASDGMLVKRPLLVLDDKVLVGFKQEEWKTFLK